MTARFRGVIERGDGSRTEVTYECPPAPYSTARATDFRDLDGEPIVPEPGERLTITFAGSFTATVQCPHDIDDEEGVS